MLENDSIASLIGFAIKSKNVVMGFDGISVKKKPPFVIFMRDDTSPNTFKKVEAYAKARSIKLYLFTDSLNKVLGSSQCKVLAIYDRALSDGILNKLKKTKTNYTEVTTN